MLPKPVVVRIPPNAAFPVENLSPDGSASDVATIVDLGGGNFEVQWQPPSTGLRRSGASLQVGDGLNAAVANAFMDFPLPFDGQMVSWYARLNVSGSATWTIEYTSSVTGTFAGVGGTQPFVSGAIGDQDLSLNWTTTNFVEGGVLRITLTSITTAQTASITIGFEKST